MRDCPWNPDLSDSKLCPPVSTTHTPGIKQNICPKEVYNQIGKISYINTENITNIARCQRDGLNTCEISEGRQAEMILSLDDLVRLYR